MNTEPKWNEEDLEDSLMDDLPVGGETLSTTKEQDESCDRLKEFFANAWIH